MVDICIHYWYPFLVVEENSDIGVVAGGITSGLLFLAVGVAILIIIR